MTPISQRDLRWKDIQLGTSGLSVGQAGCTVTALAYILDTTPDIVNQKLIDGKGYADGNLVIWSKLKSIFKEIKDVKRVIGYKNTEVLTNLPCLVEVDGAPIGAKKHWVVFIGNKLMMDPWFGSIKNTGFYRPTGYAIVKVDTINTGPIAQDLDIRLSILDENNIKTESELRELLGKAKDATSLQTDKLNADKEIDRLRHEFEQAKSDLKTESDANTALKMAYESHLQTIGKEVGNGPDLPGILHHISTIKSRADLTDKFESQVRSLKNDNADLKAEIIRRDEANKSYSLKIESLESELAQIKEILSKWLKIPDLTTESLTAALDGLRTTIEKPFFGVIIESIKRLFKR